MAAPKDLVSLLATVTQVVGVLSSYLSPLLRRGMQGRGGGALELGLLTGQWRNGWKGVGGLELRIDEKAFEEKACKL